MAERLNGAIRPDHLRALAAKGTIRTFRRQTVIVSEGDDNESFHVILEGRVRIFVSDEHGKEIVISTHGPDEHFGEVVGDEGPRCASAITLEPSRIAIVPKARFVQFLSDHPEFAIRVLQKAMRTVRALTQKVKALALMDVYGRVARLLTDVAAARGTRSIERMTQQEIASRVGASREMISRVMRDLAADGYISVDKTHITILKRPRSH
jgi:CRP/FNR family cyclic AMP-dependent transcriptional regulator